MKNLEFNKLAAAVLVAGIVALGANIASNHLFHQEKLEGTPGFPVEGGAVAATPAAADAPKKANPIGDLLKTADVTAGQAVAKKCLTCHVVDKGGANKTGPGLWDIVGHDKAAHAGYTYSKALLAMKGQQWGYEELNQFLYKPSKYAPGTKMGFAGIEKDQDRANLILYLRSLSDNPKPLP
jgi:cytochrome c